MITRLTQPSVKGRRSIRTGSLPATQPAVARATAAALPQVTMPHPAPVSSANRRAPIRCRPSEPRPGSDAVPKTNPQPRCGAVVDLRTCGLASALAAELRSRCAQPGAVRLLFCAISADFHLAPATLLILGRIEEQPATMVAGALLDARHVALHQQRQGGEGYRPKDPLDEPAART